MKKILSEIHIPDEVAKHYSDRFHLVYPDEEPGKFSPEYISENLKDACGYIGNTLTAKMIDNAPKLEIASSSGAGFDGIDDRYAGSKGVWVMNAPSGTTEATAELTIAILLCVTRKIFNHYRFFKESGICNAKGGLYADAFDNAPRSMLVFGKTLGIIGFGKIGKAVAKKAIGIGMKVIYYDVLRASEELEKEIGVRYVSFDELLKTADCVTIHTILSPETKHIMGAKQFGMMKPDAYFINAGRGGLMDEKALISAIKNKKIAGAALDVFENEPGVSPELFDMDEVVIVPHIGTSIRECRVQMSTEALDGIAKQLSGGESPTIVNRKYYKAK